MVYTSVPKGVIVLLLATKESPPKAGEYALRLLVEASALPEGNWSSPVINFIALSKATSDLSPNSLSLPAYSAGSTGIELVTLPWDLIPEQCDLYCSTQM